MLNSLGGGLHSIISTSITAFTNGTVLSLRTVMSNLKGSAQGWQTMASAPNLATFNFCPVHSKHAFNPFKQTNKQIQIIIIYPDA